MVQILQFILNDDLEGLRKLLDTSSISINKEENLNWEDPEDDEMVTPLEFAVANNPSYSIIELLIKKGADINKKNEIGETPLIFGLKRGKFSYETIKLLIEKGADINAKDQDGRTPLMTALFERASDEIIKLLIEKGADVNAKDEDEWTPLMYALSEGASYEIIKLLIDSRADVNTRDNDGWTPLMYALSRGAGHEIIKLLIEKGADVKEGNENGVTPLTIALEKQCSYEIINLLLEKISQETFDLVTKMELLLFFASNDLDTSSILKHEDLKGFRGLDTYQIKQIFQGIKEDSIEYIKPYLRNLKSEKFISYLESKDAINIKEYVEYLIKLDIKQKFEGYTYLSEVVCDMKHILNDDEIRLLKDMYSIKSDDRSEICQKLTEIMKEKQTNKEKCTNDTFILGDDVKDVNTNSLFTITDYAGVVYCFNEEDIENVINSKINPWNRQPIPREDIDRLKREYENYKRNRLQKQPQKEPMYMKKIDRLWNIFKAEKYIESDKLVDIRKMTKEQLDYFTDKFEEFFQTTIIRDNDLPIYRLNIMEAVVVAIKDNRDSFLNAFINEELDSRVKVVPEDEENLRAMRERARTNIRLE